MERALEECAPQCGHPAPALMTDTADEAYPPPSLIQEAVSQFFPNVAFQILGMKFMESQLASWFTSLVSEG